MDRNPVVLYKTLVVGIIVLLLGIGIQPAIANVSNISISDSKDDCEICPKVSNKNLVLIKSLINRLEIFEKQLSVLSRFYPEFEDKYQEVSEAISTIQGLNIGDDLCTILGMIVIITMSIVSISFSRELMIIGFILDITFGPIFILSFII
ncbi:MAG: hypothetical protein JSU91_08205, partial [Thermoplasmatales archaeon]